MTRTRKIFTATTADQHEPIPFDVELTNAAGEKRLLEFEAIGTAPADGVMLLTKMARVTNRGEAVIDGNGMAEFMDAALLGDGPERWREMITDKDWRVEASVIGKVVEYIQEEWAGRPTEPSPSSAHGRRNTSDNLTDSPS